MKKLFSKIMMFVLSLAAVLVLAGCDYEAKIIIDADGNVDAIVEEWISEDEMKELMISMGADADETAAMTADELAILFADEEGYIGTRIGENGQTYFGIVGDQEEVDFEGNENYTVTASEFIYTPSASEDEEASEEELTEEDMAALNEMMKYTMFVTMPDEIVFTNGELSADRKTVSFKIDLLTEDAEALAMYAYTAKSDKIITLEGVTDGKYTNGKKVTVVTADKVESIKVNGVEQTSKTISTKEDGVYTIEVVTANSEKTFTVIRDTAKPKVTGVKNKKTYSKSVTIKFSDSASGIKSATLNGKKISSKKKVKAEGDYTLVVTDNAGNKKTVKFTIKK